MMRTSKTTDLYVCNVRVWVGGRQRRLSKVRRPTVPYSIQTSILDAQTYNRIWARVEKVTMPPEMGKYVYGFAGRTQNHTHVDRCHLCDCVCVGTYICVYVYVCVFFGARIECVHELRFIYYDLWSTHGAQCVWINWTINTYTHTRTKRASKDVPRIR